MCPLGVLWLTRRQQKFVVADKYHVADICRRRLWKGITISFDNGAAHDKFIDRWSKIECTSFSRVIHFDQSSRRHHVNSNWYILGMARMQMARWARQTRVIRPLGADWQPPTPYTVAEPRRRGAMYATGRYIRRHGSMPRSEARGRPRRDKREGGKDQHAPRWHRLCAVLCRRHNRPARTKRGRRAAATTGPFGHS